MRTAKSAAIRVDHPRRGEGREIIKGLELRIEKLVYGGDGLTRLPEDKEGRRKAVFVRFALPGEAVEAHVTEEHHGFARAELDAVLKASDARVQPGCPYFGQCGGCHYQHASYEEQVRLKAEILRETVSRIAKLELPEIEAHTGEPWKYRNRTRMRVHAQGEFAIGYYHMGTHKLMPARECPISSPLINRALQAVWTLGESGAVPAEVAEMEFFANADDSELLIELHTASGAQISTPKAGPNLGHKLKELLPELLCVAVLPRAGADRDDSVAAPELSSQRDSDARAKVLLGKGSLRYKAAGFDYRVSAGSFFQTNRLLVDELVRVVTGDASGRLAMDLYAGAGLFTLPLAKSFERVSAVEASPQSFSDLQHNAPAEVKAIAATTDRYLQESRGAKPDYVVVDPPRAGLGKKVVEALTKLNAPQLTYVSCDPSTLARDLPALLGSGYRVEKAHLFDLFPQTFHIETVLRLAR